MVYFKEYSGCKESVIIFGAIIKPKDPPGDYCCQRSAWKYYKYCSQCGRDVPHWEYDSNKIFPTLDRVYLQPIRDADIIVGKKLLETNGCKKIERLTPEKEKEIEKIVGLPCDYYIVA